MKVLLTSANKANYNIDILFSPDLSQYANRLTGTYIDLHGYWIYKEGKRYFFVEKLSIIKPAKDNYIFPEALHPLIEWMKRKGLKSQINKLKKMRLKKLLSIIENPYLLLYEKILTFSESDIGCSLIKKQNINSTSFKDDPKRIEAAVFDILTNYYKNQSSFRVSENHLLDNICQYDISRNVSIPPSKLYVYSLGYYYPTSIFYMIKFVRSKTLNATPLPNIANVSCDTELLPILNHRYCIISGAAGTGKTTLIKRIASLPLKTIVAASTGKASQNITDTNVNASTIHSVLGFGAGGFKVKELDCDILIIDEASMLDWYTTQAIFRACKGHVVFVGDKDQLPPVEGGSVFEELMNHLPVIELSKFVRYSNGVHTRIIDVEEKDMIKKLIEIVKYLEKNNKEYQIITPLNIGKCGTKRLNKIVQSVLNGNSKTLFDKFKENDKVIITKNYYLTDVFAYNGEIGHIQEYDEGHFWIKTKNATVNLPVGCFELGYAITIHKSQGSQWDYVIVIIPRELLGGFINEKMLYTATSRARKMTILLKV